MASVPSGPVGPAERIASLDVLRGFALLGILAMNVQSFAQPAAAYFNPTAWGSLAGAEGWVWALSHVFVDQKFMTPFSLLFGAGIVLMAGRAEARGQRAGRLHARRMGWLLLFGLAHAYLLWYGDILATYAIAGLLVFPLRKLAPRRLAAAGLAAIAVPSLLFLALGSAVPTLPAEEVAHLREGWAPSQETLAAELAAYRGGWASQLEHRVPMALEIHTFYLPAWLLWRAGGLMLLGMALFKLGVLSATRSRRFYATLAAAGIGAGVPIIVAGVLANQASGWSFPDSMFVGFQYNYWGSLLVALGYAGLVMLAAHAASPWVRAATAPLGAVGRMAFTNYILQTLIATTVFYGHGLGLFGTVDRVGQAAFVVAVVAVQMVVSTLWLRRFAIGPFEWAWRSLTYLRAAPWRAPAGAAA